MLSVVRSLDTEYRPPTTPAAMANRRVLRVLHRRLRLSGGTDVRNLDTACAAVECASDRRRVVAMHAQNRTVPGQVGSSDHMLDVLPARRAGFTTAQALTAAGLTP